MSNTAVEIDQWTRAGHQNFMARLRLETERGLMTWHEWLEWQRTRNPINENPVEAEKVRAKIDASLRGPGITKRPLRKAVAKRPSSTPDSAEKSGK